MCDFRTRPLSILNTELNDRFIKNPLLGLYPFPGKKMLFNINMETLLSISMDSL